MPDEIEVLRRGYEAFARGDIDAIVEDFEDDIEFVGPNSQQVAGAGSYAGKAAVAGLFAAMRERWDGLTWTPEEFVREGETVVVLGHMEGRAKATGTALRVPFVHVWRMSGGRVRRGRAFTDTAAVADALGAR
jgi:ketosteroid isomerase-like protein